jgi:hypothetical protein
MAFDGRVHLSRGSWAEPVHAGRDRQFPAVNIVVVPADGRLDSCRLPGGDLVVLKRHTLVVWLRVPVGIVREFHSCLGRGRISRRRRTIRSSEPGQVRGFALVVEG